MRPTIICAGVAGSSYFCVQGPITAGGVGGMRADTVWFRGRVPIVRAKKCTLTG